MITNVHVEEIEDGMLAAEDVKMGNGTLIIRKGAELEGKHMNLLKAAGINSIKVEVPEKNGKATAKLHIDQFPEDKEKLASAKIMIVDDSKLMRLKLRKIIEEAGLTLAGQAENGAEAVAMVKELHPSFITMDIEMPEMNGIEAVAAIHKEFPKIKIAMISSLGQEDLIIESISAGAVDFINKPFDPEKVKRAIFNNIISDHII